MNFGTLQTGLQGSFALRAAADQHINDILAPPPIVYSGNWDFMELWKAGDISRSLPYTSLITS